MRIGGREKGRKRKWKRDTENDGGKERLILRREGEKIKDAGGGWQTEEFF